MKHFSILSAQMEVPDFVLTNDGLSKMVETSGEWIESRTGILSRRVSTGEGTSEMCVKLAEKLVKTAGINPEEIGLIIVATVTPDYRTPSTACIVQCAINAKNAFAFDINAACSGFLYALSITSHFLDDAKYAIVIGAETLSKMVDWTDRKTCVLFGDGAGGVLIKAGGEHGIVFEVLRSDGSRWESLAGGYEPVRNPFSPELEAPEKFLKMDGREVFDFAIKEVPSCITRLLENARLTLDDIAYIIPHQANRRIVEACAKKLGTPLEKFYINIQKYGNTSSASIPICLAEMVSQGLIRLGGGEKLILVGFGGGLTWGGQILTV